MDRNINDSRSINADNKATFRVLQEISSGKKVKIQENQQTYREPIYMYRKLYNGGWVEGMKKKKIRKMQKKHNKLHTKKNKMENTARKTKTTYTPLSKRKPR